MFSKKVKIIFVFLPIAGLLLSCSHSMKSFRDINYTIPENVNLSFDEISKTPIQARGDKASRLTISVLIYYYSSATEVMSYSGSGEMVSAIKPGRLKAVVRLMDGDSIVRAEFIEVTGAGKDELLNAFSESLNKLMSR